MRIHHAERYLSRQLRSWMYVRLTTLTKRTQVSNGVVGAIPDFPILNSHPCQENNIQA